MPAIPENTGPYVDLAGWLPVPSAVLLRRLMREHDVRTVLEIGSFCGLSTLLFALHADRVTALDTFTGSEEEYLWQANVFWRIKDQRAIFDGNMRAFGVEDRVTVLACDSTAALAQLAEQGARFDLTYIDGDHREEQVRRDIAGALPLTTKVLCGDDYTAPFPGVRAAVDDLLPTANREQRCWYAVLG